MKKNRQSKYDVNLIKELYDKDTFKSLIDNNPNILKKEKDSPPFLYNHYKHKIPKYLIKNRIKLYQLTGD
jgi:hypothetical protein